MAKAFANLAGKARAWRKRSADEKARRAEDRAFGRRVLAANKRRFQALKTLKPVVTKQVNNLLANAWEAHKGIRRPQSGELHFFSNMQLAMERGDRAGEGLTGMYNYLTRIINDHYRDEIDATGLAELKGVAWHHAQFMLGQYADRKKNDGIRNWPHD